MVTEFVEDDGHTESHHIVGAILALASAIVDRAISARVAVLAHALVVLAVTVVVAEEEVEAGLGGVDDQLAFANTTHAAIVDGAQVVVITVNSISLAGMDTGAIEAIASFFADGRTTASDSETRIDTDASSFGRALIFDRARVFIITSRPNRFGCIAADSE